MLFSLSTLPVSDWYSYLPYAEEISILIAYVWAWAREVVGWPEDSGDCEADLPELVNVAPEESVVDDVYTNGDHDWAAEMGEEDFIAESSSSAAAASGIGYCKTCREFQEAASKGKKPQGWLVFHKVYGVIPQEVLELWREEEKARLRCGCGGGGVVVVGGGARSSTLRFSKDDVVKASPRHPPPVGGNGNGVVHYKSPGCCHGSSGSGSVSNSYERNHPRRLPPVRRPPS